MGLSYAEALRLAIAAVDAQPGGRVTAFALTLDWAAAGAPTVHHTVCFGVDPAVAAYRLVTDTGGAVTWPYGTGGGHGGANHPRRRSTDPPIGAS